MRVTLIGFAAALLLGGCPVASGPADTLAPDALLIFHNNTGPMCMAALDWLADMQAAHPAVTIEEHLTYETGETARLMQFKALHAASQGVSESFEYLPIIFYQGQAFSGFNDEVVRILETLLEGVESVP